MQSSKPKLQKAYRRKAEKVPPQMEAKRISP